jgi:predicted transposase YbfD/YdcC
LDVSILEQHLADYVQTLAQPVTAPSLITAPGQVRQGQAVDGKAVRGASRQGPSIHLVSLVEHGSGKVYGQIEVEQKSNEIPAVPRLLAGRDLSTVVITVDALHTHSPLAQQILDQGGHYVMVVKENQPELVQAIALLFDQPPWLEQERTAEYQVTKTVNKGHGRREIRQLESSPSLNDYLDWPGLGQVFRRHCERLILKTGEITRETRYGLTSLRPEQASAAQLEVLCRGHWTIENRVHYVRDVSWGEDAGLAHVGNTPHALAALRNAILSLFRSKGWTNIADALRYYAASAQHALALIVVSKP